MEKRILNGKKTSGSIQKAGEDIARLILGGKIKNRVELWEAKGRASEKYGVARVVRNSAVLERIPEGKRTRKVVELLRIKPMRTVSGVNVIAVMTKGECPGKCIYCPRGENAPKSYTGKEPAAMRAIQNDYDPFRQVDSRVRQLEEIGHRVSKCELIVMGGTFNYMPAEYESWFIKRCFDAMNGFKSKNLEEAQLANEKAARRVVGLTIETRPDWAGKKEVDELLRYGATRIELGVQTLSDAVYRKVNRGHGVKEVVNATQVCKDSLLKVLYHMMPGLFADKKEDVRIFRKLFEDERFRPDMLKIYPCLVMERTKLYDLWKKGEFKPYSAEEAADVIADAMKFVPRYVRVMRVQRDIPSYLIADGVKKSNLRQIVEQRLAEEGRRCQCIRCREIGYRISKNGVKPDMGSVKLNRIDYDASEGKEIFLSFDEMKHDALIGFLRLRIPSEKEHRKELKNAGGVRELHVYGEMLPVGEKRKKEFQHMRFGRRLLEEAEKIANEEFDCRKLAVISGVGARDYYFKLGYKRDGPYVSKDLD
ncbi:tRNA uridine(34) 5-carboxymethylaminomethyl modification radical SAM/GNAT enzyme Elp3 [Candidatus Micrarchaeota archaeon]|nr:tRNA uridine(34) 5-carboxymethylaminomethyl modification radical SAM/GNAT enzyme Elp3 [Candidatus Micrarchaeota archaeon]